MSETVSEFLTKSFFTCRRRPQIFGKLKFWYVGDCLQIFGNFKFWNVGDRFQILAISNFEILGNGYGYQCEKNGYQIWIKKIEFLRGKWISVPHVARWNQKLGFSTNSNLKMSETVSRFSTNFYSKMSETIFRFSTYSKLKCRRPSLDFRQTKISKKCRRPSPDFWHNEMSETVHGQYPTFKSRVPPCHRHFWSDN